MNIFNTGSEKEGVYLPVKSNCFFPPGVTGKCDENGFPLIRVVAPATQFGNYTFYPNTQFIISSPIVAAGTFNFPQSAYIEVDSNARFIGDLTVSGNGETNIVKGGALFVNNYAVQGGSLYIQESGSYVESEGTWGCFDSNVQMDKKSSFYSASDLNYNNCSVLMGYNAYVRTGGTMNIQKSNLVIDISQNDLDSLNVRKLFGYANAPSTKFDSITINPKADLCATISTDYRSDGLYVSFNVKSRNLKCTEIKSSASKYLFSFVVFIFGLILI